VNGPNELAYSLHCYMYFTCAETFS